MVGGAKGFYTICVLKGIEGMFGCRLHEQFDLVVHPASWLKFLKLGHKGSCRFEAEPGHATTGGRNHLSMALDFLPSVKLWKGHPGRLIRQLASGGAKRGRLGGPDHAVEPLDGQGDFALLTGQRVDPRPRADGGSLGAVSEADLAAMTGRNEHPPGAAANGARRPRPAARCGKAHLTSQSSRWRMAARCCLTVGAASSRDCASIQVTTCSGWTAAIDVTPCPSHQARNSPTARQ